MPQESRDPQPGDFDEELLDVEADAVEIVEPAGQAAVSIQVTVQGEDAVTLERIARRLGKRPGDVVAELLRDAEQSAF